MKKRIFAFAVSLFLTAWIAFPSLAMTEDKSKAIQAVLDGACRVSGTPGMSLTVVEGDAVRYFSSGCADREKNIPVNEDSLFELASVSKAFTGFAVLLLEEQGLLSVDDSVQKYLPWLELNYKGQPVNMSGVTLGNFLHHTSGITNARHTNDMPQGNTPDMLRKTVEKHIKEGLAFLPGEEYNYGTVNYDVLGLVIEAVSGLSYEEFMTENVFKPLGLNDTYLYGEQAEATGRMAKGYRTSFLMTLPYDAPVFGGNKPAGYIITSAKDMAEWLRVQLNLVEDLPDVYKTVIEKSHEGDISVPADGGLYYAAGWEVNAERTVAEHAGNNPNFATYAVLFPEEQTGLCLLTNGAGTNVSVAIDIKAILDGGAAPGYKISYLQLLDIFCSIVAFISMVLAVLLTVLGFKRRKRNTANTKKGMKPAAVVWAAITFLLSVLCAVLPSFFGFGWPTALIWLPYSVLAASVTAVLTSASAVWFCDMINRSK